jgi:serine/threonine protein phosphatase PrpC
METTNPTDRPGANRTPNPYDGVCSMSLGHRTLDISWASRRGERFTQEDRLHLDRIPGVGLILSALDGHGGDDAVIAAVAELKALTQLPVPQGTSPETVLLNAFDSLVRRTDGMHSGAAATIVLIPESGDEIAIGVLGDCPAMRVSEDDVFRAPEHNVGTNDAELRRAEARGAWYNGGYIMAGRFGMIGLQMSRALGDCALDEVLDRQPEIVATSFVPGDTLIVGTDGLYYASQRRRNDSMRLLAAQARDGRDATFIVEDAERRKTRDNASVFVVRHR